MGSHLENTSGVCEGEEEEGWKGEFLIVLFLFAFFFSFHPNSDLGDGEKGPDWKWLWTNPVTVLVTSPHLWAPVALEEWILASSLSFSVHSENSV